MFTGIVQSKQPVVSFDTDRLVVSFSEKLLTDLQIGASICVSGICLTAVDIDGSNVHFDVSEETKEKTTLGAMQSGDLLNVERSYKIGDEVGGHILSGHVIGMGEVTTIQDYVWTFRVSKDWMKYVMEKGFIAIDGCSLTIVDPDAQIGTFSVAFIPETLQGTTFANKKVGDSVNIEIDSQTQAIVETTERILAQQGLD